MKAVVFWPDATVSLAEAPTLDDCLARLRSGTGNTFTYRPADKMIFHNGRPVGIIFDSATATQAAVERAGFRVAKNLAHPFLGPTPEDQATLWCQECDRDSGFHWNDCSKANKHDADPTSAHNPSNVTIFYAPRGQDTWLFWCVCNRTTLESQRAKLQEKRCRFIVNDHEGKQIEEFTP